MSSSSSCGFIIAILTGVLSSKASHRGPPPLRCPILRNPRVSSYSSQASSSPSSHSSLKSSIRSRNHSSPHRLAIFRPWIELLPVPSSQSEIPQVPRPQCHHHILPPDRSGCPRVLPRLLLSRATRRVDRVSVPACFLVSPSHASVVPSTHSSKSSSGSSSSSQSSASSPVTLNHSMVPYSSRKRRHHLFAGFDSSEYPSNSSSPSSLSSHSGFRMYLRVPHTLAAPHTSLLHHRPIRTPPDFVIRVFVTPSSSSQSSSSQCLRLLPSRPSTVSSSPSVQVSSNHSKRAQFIASRPIAFT